MAEHLRLCAIWTAPTFSAKTEADDCRVKPAEVFKRIGGKFLFHHQIMGGTAGLASDQTINSLVEDFPDLDPEKVCEVLEYEASAIDEDRLVARQKSR